MTVVRIDPHAHLYDAYSVHEWCRAATNNLRKDPSDIAVVIVVDREGQDSFARLRREAPSFATWRESADGRWGVVESEGQKLFVIRGVQYVAAEKIEVLGLGVGRSLADKLPAEQYIEAIQNAGGVPCLPWSPGKWLGKRGGVVRRLLESNSPASLTVGDIAIRSRVGPPSLLLQYAKKRGYRVLYGTDPLPLTRDVGLIGSLGVEISDVSFLDESLGVTAALRALIDPASPMRQIGRRNSGCQAVRRFVEQSLASR